MDSQSWVSKKVAEHPELVDMVVFKSDLDNNDYILTIGNQKILCIWNIDKCKVEFHTELDYTPRVADVSEGKDKQFAAIGCDKNQVAILYLHTRVTYRKLKVFYRACNTDSPIMSICIHKHVEAQMRLTIGCVDGRICLTDVNHLENSELKLKDRFLFRAHRDEVRNNPEQSYLFQVNGVLTHPKYPKLMYSYGGDSTIFLWNYDKKNTTKKICFGKVPFTAAEISPDGTFLAMCLGSDWSKGVWDLEDNGENFMPRIVVYLIKNQDVK